LSTQSPDPDPLADRSAGDKTAGNIPDRPPAPPRRGRRHCIRCIYCRCRPVKRVESVERLRPVQRHDDSRISPASSVRWMQRFWPICAAGRRCVHLMQRDAGFLRSMQAGTRAAWPASRRWPREAWPASRRRPASREPPPPARCGPRPPHEPRGPARGPRTRTSPGNSPEPAR
jgi:hypothetical protein